MNHSEPTPRKPNPRIKWSVSTINPNDFTHPPRATSGTKLSPGELSPGPGHHLPRSRCTQVAPSKADRKLGNRAYGARIQQTSTAN